MKERRTFLALPLHEKFHQEIQGFLSRARGDFREVRWVKPEQVHITLHFFGATPEGDIGSICRYVAPVAVSFPRLRIQLNSIGFFPSERRPRIIWLGIDGDTAKLTDLQQTVERKLKIAGYETEERAFKAHATVGRIKQPGIVLDDLSRLKFSKTKFEVIDYLALYESKLSADGPQYEIIEKFPFAGVQTA